MHPAGPLKTQFPIERMQVQPGMIVQFMYKSTYHRAGRPPKGPRNTVRTLLVTDPYYAREKGGGGEGLARAFYMWGIDLEKIQPAELAMFAKKYGITYAGPYNGPRIQGTFKNVIPLVNIPGNNGLAKWNVIKSQDRLLKNFRSYVFDKIQSCRVVQYNFTEPQLAFKYEETQKKMEAKGYVPAGDATGQTRMTTSDSEIDMISRGEYDQFMNQKNQQGESPGTGAKQAGDEAQE